MAKKSSKTDRVLNLIMTGNEETSEDDNKATSTSEKKIDAQDVTIVKKKSLDEDVVKSINEALETEITQMKTDEVKVNSDNTNKPTADNQKSTTGSIEEYPDFVVENMMQSLVLELIPEYVESMQICNCERCAADIQALALTALPAKYVVVEPHAISPLKNYYRSKFSSRITVELMRAAQKVKQSPKHKI